MDQYFVIWQQTQCCPWQKMDTNSTPNERVCWISLYGTSKTQRGISTASSLHNNWCNAQRNYHCKKQYRRSILWVFISVFQYKCSVVLFKQNGLMLCASLSRNKIQLNSVPICILDSLAIKIQEFAIWKSVRNRM